MSKIIEWLKANKTKVLAGAAVLGTIAGALGWQFVVRVAGPDEKPGVVITLPSGVEVKSIDGHPNADTVIVK
jgi:hypothetical protein